MPNMANRGFLLAASVLLACSPPAPAADLSSIQIPYEKFVLPNGLTLIVHEDHKVPIVAVNVWYHVGSKDERPGRTGFAHLFEHLMFNGSEHYNDDFFRALEPVGVTKMNGTTWLDRTNYFQNVPTSALDLTLWLESDRMGHLLGAIDQEKLDAQRGVVQNEKRQGENQPYGKVDAIIATNTYPVGHPYSWETVGSMEDLNAASLADVQEWFGAYYGAANAVLVLAGDITAADAKRKVEQYFGDIPSGPPIQRKQAWVAKMSGEKRVLLQEQVPQARLSRTWNIPGYNTRDFTLLGMTAGILGSGKNSRLYQRLVYKDQLATDVQVGVGPFEIGSQLQIQVMVKAGGDVRKVERALDEELAAYLRTGPTGAEIDRVTMATYADLARGMERIDGSGGKSYVLAESEVFGGSPDFYRRQLDWMQVATPRDVKDATTRWLSDGVFVLEVQPFPEHTAVASSADRSKAPEVGAPPPLQLPPLQRATLSNGLKVVLAERHNAPVVDLSLIFDAGFAADSLAAPGTAKLTMAMLDEGTNRRNSRQITTRAEQLGAQLGVGSSLDTSILNVNAIAGQLAPSLELFSDVLMHPTFPAADFELLRSQMLAGIEQEKNQPAGMAMRVFPSLVYGESHAYGNPASGNGSTESVTALTRGDLQAFHRRWLRPDNATLVVVGATKLDVLRPLLEQYLASWKTPAEPLPQKNIAAVAAPTRPRVFLMDRSGGDQAVIIGGYAGPPRSDPDFAAMQTLNTILGGAFVSRINMNLREDKHWAYGASSRLSKTKGPGTFVVRAPVQSDKTGAAMQEILKEINDLRGSKPPTDAEIGFARDSLVLRLPGNNETATEVADSYVDAVTYGLADSYWSDFVEQVRGMTALRLQPAAQKLLRPEALTWVVVGDLKTIEPQVRALNLGEVSVVDSDGKRVR
jgi:zinc protease